jgi:hypothetical protein
MKDCHPDNDCHPDKDCHPEWIVRKKRVVILSEAKDLLFPGSHVAPG